MLEAWACTENSCSDMSLCQSPVSLSSTLHKSIFTSMISVFPLIWVNPGQWPPSFGGLIVRNLSFMKIFIFFQAPVIIFSICRLIQSPKSGENFPLEPQMLFYFGSCHDGGKVVSTVVSQHEHLRFQAFPRRNPPKQALFTELSGCVYSAVTFLRFWPTT